MHKLTQEIKPGDFVRERSVVIFQAQLDTDRRHTDRMFAWLMALQAVAGIAAACLISPRAWAGSSSQIHLHVWAAIFVGGTISGFPFFMALAFPGRTLTRHLVAAGQMLSCGLFIHLTGGRIESHFQYFGTLAFLAFYRDWRVLATASVVAGVDHLFRGWLWPESMYGALTVNDWRSLEHVGWILFEDIFLLLAIRQNLKVMLATAEREAQLETVNETIEHKVAERTAELRTEIEVRRQTEEKLRLAGSAMEQSQESILITGPDLDLPGPRIIFVNPAFTKMTGYTSAEVIGKTPRILQGPRTDKSLLHRLRKNLERGEAFAGETVNYRKDGTEFSIEWQVAPLRDPSGKITHFVAIQHDISERKHIEARLLQSQKMETVGKLAGGVAHEFNSILTAIIGQSEFLLSELPPGDPSTKSAIEIRQAADRAASLTRQLLAYGRKQILQPEVLNFNRVIADMLSTLQLLMGKEVDVRIVPALGLKKVKIDPGQLEQVIVSIAMNASEAMPNGGQFTLETANVTLGEDYVKAYPGLKPGGYVLLAITDAGVGMTNEVKARIFEPFFTTKEVGQGKGLGLATCYGIVKQSEGHITVYSEVARGSTFKIYLPQVEEMSKTTTRRLYSENLPTGTETILLAEDDPSLLAMSAALLRRLGYHVLTATNGIEALNLKHQRDIGHIDLLLTDVVMPHMSGKELSDRIRAIYPQTRILFTSAYTENAIVNQGMLDEGVNLLQKPFTPSALAHKVRETLDPYVPDENDSPRRR